MTRSDSFWHRSLAGGALLAVLLALGGCKSVAGRVWLPVYSDQEEAGGRVTVHFTADCVAAGGDEALVRLRYVDTVADINFDAEGFAPLCSTYDSLYGMYGRYDGFYYPDDVLETSSRRRPGTFFLQIVDGGTPGYSEDDYLCFRLEGGGFEQYELPAWDDVNGDGSRDEGCAYIGGGVIQINLDGTTPS